MFTSPRKFKRTLIRSGDMKHRITLQSKVATPPGSGVDLTEVFTDVCNVFAALEIVNPKVPFDDINTDLGITHRFYIRHVSGVTLDNWVLHQLTRYKIAQIVNLNGLNDFLRLDCNLKGLEANEASKW